MSDATENKEDRRKRLEAEALAAESEADAALTIDEAEEFALLDRIEKANQRKAEALLLKRRGVMNAQAKRLREAANGAHIVEPFDMEDATPGGGLYVLRSPTVDGWKVFQNALGAAGDDHEKQVRAYNNFAASCILWQDAPDGEAWIAHRNMYPHLVVAIGDAAGRLGGAAVRARKR